MTPPPVLNARQTEPKATEMAAVLGRYRTESGRTLLELLDESPLLLIFLRHFGCSFCRQTLDDVSRIRAEIEKRGIRPVFVHLGSPERAKPYFDYYHLSDVERVSDPEASLYTCSVFQLQRKNVFSNLLVPAVWKAWLLGAVRKHGIGMIKEDGDQMPGIFYLRERVIVRAFRYKTIADEPDYLKLIA
jgi:peroxiredoxin